MLFPVCALCLLDGAMSVCTSEPLVVMRFVGVQSVLSQPWAVLHVSTIALCVVGARVVTQVAYSEDECRKEDLGHGVRGRAIRGVRGGLRLGICQPVWPTGGICREVQRRHYQSRGSGPAHSAC